MSKLTYTLNYIPGTHPVEGVVKTKCHVYGLNIPALPFVTAVRDHCGWIVERVVNHECIYNHFYQSTAILTPISKYGATHT